MRTTMLWKIQDERKVRVAMTRDIEIAVGIVARLPRGSRILWVSTPVWNEGVDGYAADSFDAVKQRIELILRPQGAVRSDLLPFKAVAPAAVSKPAQLEPKPAAAAQPAIAGAPSPLAAEGLQSISDAFASLGVHASSWTLNDWALNGRYGAKLECYQLGRKRYTSAAAAQRYLDASQKGVLRRMTGGGK